MTEEMIKKAEKMGAKRWQKNGKDRLYINAESLGYTWERYNTGNIKNAWLNGEMISNCEMRRVLFTKTYIDVETGKVFSGYDEKHYSEQVEKFAKELGI